MPLPLRVAQQRHGESVEADLLDLHDVAEERPDARQDAHPIETDGGSLAVGLSDPNGGPRKGRLREESKPDLADRDRLAERSRQPGFSGRPHEAAERRLTDKEGGARGDEHQDDTGRDEEDAPAHDGPIIPRRERVVVS
jgi:hypothetical protein